MKTNKSEQKSILVRDQTKKVYFLNKEYNGQKVDLIITLRYDDECGNGLNSFSITGELYKASRRNDSALISCGCLHDEIKVIAPEYSKFIKWHLMSSKEPLYYFENTLYWANNNNLTYARHSAIWEDATLEELRNKDLLKKRLPKLLNDFIHAMEELGFKY